MANHPDRDLEKLLPWLATVLGPFEVISDHTRAHAGQRASAIRLRTPAGECFVKLHRDRAHWENEVHAYERWAPAFDRLAPRLLAVRAAQPLAVVIGALPGTVLEEVQLTAPQGQAVWHAAGQALRGLHTCAAGEWFGACQRDGTCAGTPVSAAIGHLTSRLDNLMDRGLRGDFLSPAESAIVRAARNLLPAFAGEAPVPCHRDYCPANWLVSGDGAWTGVIDFEFAGWDVWVTDFTRDPGWNWIHHPELLEALRAGYGRAFTSREEQQLLLAHALYALDAIVWGEENDYHGFAGGGRLSLQKVSVELDH